MYSANAELEFTLALVARTHVVTPKLILQLTDVTHLICVTFFFG